jgi:hypothetical protein
MSRISDRYTAEVHYEPDCPPEMVRQVLAALDRWSDRTGNHVTHARASERHDYRTNVIVEASDPAVFGGSSFRRVFHVPARNVSKTGLGFVAPPVFVPRMSSDATPLMRADVIFRLGAKVKVTLGLVSDKTRTLTGEIIRVRPIHHGFLDVGVRFVASDSQNPSPNP